MKSIIAARIEERYNIHAYKIVCHSEEVAEYASSRKVEVGDIIRGTTRYGRSVDYRVLSINGEDLFCQKL